MEKNITFILDSGSDYEPSLANYLNYPVKVLPLHLLVDGKQYLDGVDMTKDEFYQRLEEVKELPKTSQPPPQEFYDIFKPEIDNGKKIIYIAISSKLSGTMQSANMAKEMFSQEEQKRIYIFDSLNVSASVLLQLIMVDKFLSMGHSIKESLTKLEAIRENTKLLAFLDTLENLRMGGRISFANAKIGGILNIKPLITIKDGIIESVDKYRGRKKGLTYIQKFINNPANDINKDILFFAHNYNNEEQLKEESKLIDLSSFKKVIYLKIGSIIGTHTGPNTFGIVFQFNHNN